MVTAKKCCYRGLPVPPLPWQRWLGLSCDPPIFVMLDLKPLSNIKRDPNLGERFAYIKQLYWTETNTESVESL